MEVIFVPESQTRAGIAVVRSLGRAGFRVIAGSSDANALGLKSAYASLALIHPVYSSDEFLIWLRKMIIEENVSMIVPSSNFLFAIRGHYDDFTHLIPLQKEAAKVYPNFLKTHVVSLFEQHKDEGFLANHPESCLIDSYSDLSTLRVPDETGFGFFLKAEESKNDCLIESDQGELIFERDRSKLVGHIDNLLSRWNKVLLQSSCTGYQVGVSLLMDDGRALAANCVRDCYSEPHSKGTMSLRKTCWDQRIVDDAIKRLSLLSWKGCAMAEYRVDPITGNFWLIEINFRYWQYLHLDLYSGIDFPKYQAQWFLSGVTDFPSKGLQDIVMRDTWPGEVSYVVNQIRSKENGAIRKLLVVFTFLFLFLDFRVKSDFGFKGDRKLYWYNFFRYLNTELHNIKNILFR